MKNAEDWKNEMPVNWGEGHEGDVYVSDEWVKAIQLDAWKQGMTDAADHCLTCNILTNNPLIKETSLNIAKAIALTREAKTSL